GDVPHGALLGVAEVHGRGHAIVLHERHEPAHEVIDVTEAARLRAVAIDSERAAGERLHDEVADDATVVRIHARSVGVEDARDAHVEPATLKVHHQGLGAALAFVVAGARPGARGIASVALAL